MPYTPTERNRVGEFLMQGIAGAGQNIGAAIDRHKAESQKANTLRKAISLYDETMKDQVQTMGLRDLEGFIQGQGMKQAKTALENQAKLQAAQIKNFEDDNQRADTTLQLQQDTAAQQKAQMGALAAFARDYGAPAIPGVSSAAMLDAAQLPPGERLRQALGRNPGALTPQMLQTLVRYGDEAGGKPAWGGPAIRSIKDPRTGKEYSAFIGGPNQSELLKDAPEISPNTVATLNFRERAMRYNALNERLKALEAQLPINPGAVKPQLDQIRAEMEALASGTAPAESASPAKGGSLDDLWQKFQATRKQ